MGQFSLITEQGLSKWEKTLDMYLLFLFSEVQSAMDKERL